MKLIELIMSCTYFFSYVAKGYVNAQALNTDKILLITSYAWGNADLELLSSNTRFALSNSIQPFTIAAPNPERSYLGLLTGLSQGNPSYSSTIPTNNLHTIFKKNAYTVGHFGAWNFANKPDVNTFDNTQDPLALFAAVGNFIDEHKNSKMLATVFLPRIDINFIPGVTIDSKLPCRGKMPPGQTICVDQAYASSRNYEVSQINNLISKLSAGATVVWFPAMPNDDPSKHGYSFARSSSRGRRNSLYGLHMPCLTNFAIAYKGQTNAIDLLPTLSKMAGINGLSVDGIDLQDANAVRNSELRWFSGEPTAGHCMFQSPPFARATSVNGKNYLQLWGANRNEVYPLEDTFKWQPSRVSLPKPFETSLDFNGCKVSPPVNLQTTGITPKKPKIIALMILDDVGTVNHLLPNAPHLSAYAKEGIQFSNYHSWLICSPARAQILTSRMALNQKVGFFAVEPDVNFGRAPKGMPPYLGYKSAGSMTFLPQFFAKNGYASKLIGKLHVTAPHTVMPTYYGFDPDYLCYDCNAPANQYLNQFADSFPAESAEIIFSGAIDRSNKALAEGKPVFLYMGFKTMHSLIYASPQALAAVNCTSVATDNVIGAPRFNYPTPHLTQKGLTKIWDNEFARFMQYLQEVAPNDFMVFITSDNGPESRPPEEGGNESSDKRADPFRGMKRSTYEGGHRVMAMLLGAGRKGTIDKLVSGIDLYPTLIDLSGANKWLPTDRNGFEGVSLADCVLRDNCTKLESRTLFMETRGLCMTDCLGNGPRFLVMHSDATGDWRLLLESTARSAPSSIRRFTRTELYNVQNDAAQTNNVADLFPEKVQLLTSYLKNYRQYSGSNWPTVMVPHNGLPTNKNLRLGYRCV